MMTDDDILRLVWWFGGLTAVLIIFTFLMVIR